MPTLQSDIQRLVDGFVAQVTELARRAAIDTLQSALGHGRGGGRGGLPAIRGRGRGVKRTAGELEQQQEQFLAFVRANPGLRIEQINKQLGTTTKDLALPIRKMLADGSLKAKGKKRSTTYYAGTKGKN
jgi:hypothetical protein